MPGALVPAVERALLAYKYDPDEGQRIEPREHAGLPPDVAGAARRRPARDAPCHQRVPSVRRCGMGSTVSEPYAVKHMVAHGGLWIFAYLLFVTGPLLVLVLGSVPPSRGFAWDFAMALGYAAMGMLGVQFALTARFRRMTAPFGIDVVYYFHRWLGAFAVGLVVLHWVLIAVADPDALAPLDPRHAPRYLTAGRCAFLALAILLATSLWRRALRIEYDRWRRLHALLAVLGFLAALAHIQGAGRYLQLPAQRSLWLGATLAWIALVVYVRVWRPWRLSRTPYRVVDVRRERGRSVTLTLEPDGHAGFAYQPGQFAWLTLRASPFAMREHPFSMSSTPTQPGRVAFTVKALGDFMRTLADVRQGERAYVDGPHGSFSVDRHPAAAGFVFVAGGVGIAPVVSMLRALADRGDPRPTYLFYGNRTREGTLFLEELDALAQRGTLQVVHVLTEPPPDWSGERGFVTADVLNRHLPRARTRYIWFVCGPNPMIRLAERSLAALGVSARRIHSEIFDLA